MANIRILKQSFAGGEVSPDMAGRFDDAKAQSGLALCRNFIVQPQGGIENRPGFAFVRAAKNSGNRARLIPFTFSADQTMVIEMGAGYFRFHTNGQTLLAGTGAPYEVAHTYSDEQLADVQHIQSADVLTLVHPEHPPRELRRLGAVNWVISAINFQPSIGTPAAPILSATGHTAVKYTYEYVVTAINANNSQSGASPVATVGGNLFEAGAKVVISWTGVPGAVRYRVFKLQGGLYGYIGQTTGLSLTDDNISPDLGITPPLYDDVFNTSGRIVSVPVLAGGAGYVSQAGQVQSVTVLEGGQYYGGGFSATIIDQAGAGAGATCTTVWGPIGGPWARLIGVAITAPGSGYISPILVINSLGATVARLASTAVKASPHKVVLKVADTGTGKDAALEAGIVGGVITHVNVINGGSGYFAPSVTVAEGAGGSGALFGTPVIASSGDYPRATTYFEQRRFFAGTIDRPQQVFATRSGTESDMSYSLPVRDDDRISFRVAARDANHIRHIVPLGSLLLLTSSAEWLVSSTSDAITPGSISVRPQSYVGASKVQPLVVNNTVVYGAARGGHVREMAYNWQSSGFVSGDLSLRCAHLFDNLDIIDMAYTKAPVPIVWMVSSSGQLLGLTYVPEQQIGAWHQHTTDGVFESCAVVAEGSEDVLYCIVRRTIGGQQVRYLERLASRQFGSLSHAFFVDCGLSYDGAPVTQISGLGHLEGCEVAILVDGAVHPMRVVVGGAVQLEVPASVVHVGLPIQAQAKTLPLAAALQDGSFAQGHYKNVNKVWVRVLQSSGISIGPNPQQLTEFKSRSTETYGTPPALKNNELSLTLSPAWAAGGEIFFEQSQPLPLTILSLTAEVALGG